jgi:hypothetical protein
LRSRPLRLHSIRHEWQVTVKSPVEFHSLKPDNWVASPCGFGCMDHSPGRCFNTDWGFLYCSTIILQISLPFKL